MKKYQPKMKTQMERFAKHALSGKINITTNKGIYLIGERNGERAAISLTDDNIYYTIGNMTNEEVVNMINESE
jgi:hypothetical protein